VRCITPQCLVAFHTGYDVDAGGWDDVQALCDRFDLPVPDDYQRFRDHPPPRARPFEAQGAAPAGAACGCVQRESGGAVAESGVATGQLSVGHKHADPDESTI
jgi:hypothetical protein